MNPEDCWAKTTPDGQPGISVCDHCLNVGCVAEALISVLTAKLRKFLPAGAVTLAAAHDIGKIAPGFLAKCSAWLALRSLKDLAVRENWAGSDSDHARISQFTLQRLLGTSKLHPWSAIVGAHHGRVKGLKVQVPAEASHLLWEENRRALVAELIRGFGPIPTDKPLEHQLWFAAGLIAVADWLGSDESAFPQLVKWSLSERREAAERALQRIAWKAPRLRNSLSFLEQFPSLQPNALQMAAQQNVHKPGVFLIEGPMGWGKTEAALVVAYQLITSGEANGLYFALPTRATSDRIHLRVRHFLRRVESEPQELRLVHGAAWLSDDLAQPELPATDARTGCDEDARAGRSWFASSRRSLLAPFGVGTIDQALLGIVAAKHFFVRQFGLAGKVVVLDEVHSYDLYTGTLVDKLIRRLRELGCTVLVLSATLTAERRAELLGVPKESLSTAYPVLAAKGDENQPLEIPLSPPAEKKVAIRLTNELDAALAEAVLARATAGQCVLWIRNTVDAAQEAFRLLRCLTSQGGPRIGLLHARLPYFRRIELEENWMTALGKESASRPRGCVLVATQVVEQSVDIDADLMLTELAPTDMMLQRIGRLWRHERVNRPALQAEIWVQTLGLDQATARQDAHTLKELLGRSGKVYAPYVLLRSWREWVQRGEISLPADIRPLLEATYAEPTADEPPSWADLRAELEAKKEKLRNLALTATMIWNNPALPDEEGVQTRYGEIPTAQLLLAKGIEPVDAQSARVGLLNGQTITGDARRFDLTLARAIHKNLTRVPRWAVAEALAKAPGWLRVAVREPVALGLWRVEDGNVYWPEGMAQSRLAYHPEEGVIIRRGQLADRTIQEEEDESYD